MQRRSIAPEHLGPTVVIGEILVEIMATTIGEGFLAQQDLRGPFPSGAPAIFIDQVARLGGSAGIVGSVGNDDFGKLNLSRLKADGVDISAVATVPGKPTGSAFVRYRQDGSRDFIFNIAHSAAGETRMTGAARDLLARSGHLHVMGSAFAIPGLSSVIAEAIDIVGGRGGSMSFDPNIRKELRQGDARKLIDEVIEASDLLLPSGQELLDIAEAETEDVAVEKLLELGVGEVVLKRGHHGATLFSRSAGRVDCAGIQVEEVDPTGAGDCFGAAYLTYRRSGLSPQIALRHANAAGAFAVTQRGPMEGVAFRRQLETFLAAASGRRSH